MQLEDRLVIGGALQSLIDDTGQRYNLLIKDGWNSSLATHALTKELLSTFSSHLEIEVFKMLSNEIQRERLRGYCSLPLDAMAALNNNHDRKSSYYLFLKPYFEFKKEMINLKHQKDEQYLKIVDKYDIELKQSLENEISKYAQSYKTHTPQKNKNVWNSLASNILEEVGASSNFNKDKMLSSSAEYVMSKPLTNAYKLVVLYNFSDATPRTLSKYTKIEPNRYSSIAFGITSNNCKLARKRINHNECYLINNSALFPIESHFGTYLLHYSRFTTLAQMEANIRCHMFMFSLVQENLEKCLLSVIDD